MLDELNTLRLISETGSLQAAAQQRGLTQSAITRQMQRLEEALRVNLLDRQVKPVRLTRAGEAVLARGRDILAAVDELRDSIAPDAQPAGTLRVGLAHGLSEPNVAAPIERFKRRLPDVYPSFQSNLSRLLIDRIVSGELDSAAILRDPDRPPPKGVECRRVGVESMTVVRAAGSAPGELRDAHWVVNPEGCLFRTRLDRWAETSFGQPLRIAAEAHDSSVQMAFVATGLGPGLISRRVLAHHPLAARLERVEVDGLVLEADVLVVRARGLGNMNLAVDILEEELRRTYSP